MLYCCSTKGHAHAHPRMWRARHSLRGRFCIIITANRTFPRSRLRKLSVNYQPASRAGRCTSNIQQQTAVADEETDSQCSIRWRHGKNQKKLVADVTAVYIRVILSCTAIIFPDVVCVLYPPLQVPFLPPCLPPPPTSLFLLGEIYSGPL